MDNPGTEPLQRNPGKDLLLADVERARHGVQAVLIAANLVQGEIVSS